MSRAPSPTELRGLPKIQYRFGREYLELDEGARSKANMTAIALGGASLPLKNDHILDRWEAHTKVAIEDYRKRQTGNPAHDEKHLGFAALYIAAVRGGGKIQNQADFQSLLDNSRPPERRPRPSGSRETSGARAQDPRKGRSVDNVLGETIEYMRKNTSADAKRLIIDGAVDYQATTAGGKDEARALFADKMSELKEKNTPGNVQSALQFAVIAAAKSERDYLGHVKQFAPDGRSAIDAEALAELRKVPPGEPGLTALRASFMKSAIADVIHDTAETTREAQVYAKAMSVRKSEILPGRQDWEELGHGLSGIL